MKVEFWSNMAAKAKIRLLIFLVVLLWAFTYFLATSVAFVVFYNHHIYSPVQSVRLFILNVIPFSIGDVLYVLGGLWLALTLARWIGYIRKINTHKEQLAGSFLNALNAGLFVYLLFLMGWGANYYKPHLAEDWELLSITKQNKSVARTLDSNATLDFNIFLVDKLNTYAPLYTTLPYNTIHARAINYYRTYTDSKVQRYGLGVKATLFGFFMQRMGVDGYYNPFTGEGQLCMQIPTFVMPFTVCHEMAHQAGIAPEGDANLLAYAIGTATNDPVFQYSAYLNLWLYANNRLFRYDSVISKKYYGQLNALSKAQLDTLAQISNKYHGDLSRYTSYVYDSYLRSQHQTEGIRSYGNATKEAWQWEQKRKNGALGLIKIP